MSRCIARETALDAREFDLSDEGDEFGLGGVPVQVLLVAIRARFALLMTCTMALAESDAIASTPSSATS